MKKSLSKKARKVIEEGVEEFMTLPPLAELTKIGAKHGRHKKPTGQCHLDNFFSPLSEVQVITEFP